MAIIAIPKILQEKLTPEGAEALVHVLDRIEDRSQVRILETTQERFEKRLVTEISKLREDHTLLRSELKEDHTVPRAELRKDITSARTDLKITEERLEKRIESVKAELIKWMFIFWIGQIGTIIAILFAFFKK